MWVATNRELPVLTRLRYDVIELSFNKTENGGYSQTTWTRLDPFLPQSLFIWRYIDICGPTPVSQNLDYNYT